MRRVGIGFLIYFQREHISRDRVLIENATVKIEILGSFKTQNYECFIETVGKNPDTLFSSLSKLSALILKGQIKQQVWILQDTVFFFKKNKPKKTAPVTETSWK